MPPYTKKTSLFGTLFCATDIALKFQKDRTNFIARKPLCMQTDDSRHKAIS
jgi:hypothetical protein